VVLVSTFHLISYLAAPLAVARLRMTEANRHRWFRLPFHRCVCVLLFFALSYVFTLSPVNQSLSIIAVFFLFLVGYLLGQYRSPKAFLQGFLRSAYVLIWMGVFTLCAVLNLGVIAVFVVSLSMYYLGIVTGGQPLNPTNK